MKSIIGISMGDPSGIGAEVTVKALANKEIYEKCTPIVVGDKAVMEDAIRFTKSNCNLNIIDNPQNAKGEYGIIDLIDIRIIGDTPWEYKKVSKLTGEAAYRYVEKAISLALSKDINAVVTGPINKEAINIAGHHYTGHTEIFAELTNTYDYGMLLASNDLKVIHVSTHVSMRKACDLITEERVYKTIKLANQGMKELGCEKPRIGVCGFNAHSSENGLFGCEEEIAIIPAIKKAYEEGYDVEGPIMPDTAFVKAMAGQYDVMIAMYHDQGHIPLKLAGFKLDLETNKYSSMSGINCTIGLPIVRTSVDHGTAFGKAGEGRANEESMVDAIYAAIQMDNYRRRQGL